MLKPLFAAGGNAGAATLAGLLLAGNWQWGRRPDRGLHGAHSPWSRPSSCGRRPPWT